MTRGSRAREGFLMNSETLARMRAAIQRASFKLTQAVPFPPTEPAPGVRYVLPYPLREEGDVALEFVVVRPHPDDPDLFLVVPAHRELQFLGSLDLATDCGLVLVASWSFWLATDQLLPEWAVGCLDLDRVHVRRIRRLLNGLATGRAYNDSGVDVDPEYDELMALVGRAVGLVQR